MHNSEFHKLFVSQLKDIYWVENKLVRTLAELEGAASSEELSKGFRKHRAQTQEHVNRLRLVFRSLNEAEEERECPAMLGLITEAKAMIAETPAESMVRDAALLIAAQKVEHYEIASYGSLVTLARMMHHDEAENVLKATLYEEKETNAQLTEMAESFINSEAAKE